MNLLINIVKGLEGPEGKSDDKRNFVRVTDRMSSVVFYT